MDVIALRNHIRELTARSDLADSLLNTFVDLTESDIETRLEGPDGQAVQTSVLLLSDEGSIALPADFKEARALIYHSTSGDKQVDQTSLQEILETRGVNVITCKYARSGDSFLLDSLSDEEEFTLWYRTAIPSSVTDGSTYMLSSYPAVYIYGLLFQTYEWLQDDDRAIKMEEKYRRSLDRLETSERRKAFTGSSPIQTLSYPQAY